MTKTLIRRFEMSETEEHGECVVELNAISWELYAISINGYEESRHVGLEYAMIALDEHCDENSPDWARTDNN